MRIRNLVVGLTLVTILGSTVAWADDTAITFANGRTLLAKADFEGALQAFKIAVTAQPENSEYFQEYTLLRRVINLRAQLKDEQDPETWQKMSQALYNYYHSRKINGEALATAGALYEKVKTGETAALLAEAQLTAGDSKAAAELLAGLDQEQRTPRTDILQGIALAYQSDAAGAKTIATRLELPKDCEGPVCYDAARLYALIGDTEKALGTLKCAFECTPPNQLDVVKADAKECKDFAALVSNPAFAQALEAKSKVAAGCGSQAGCGKCPSKAGCAGAGDKDKPPAECKGHEKAGEKPAGCEHEKKTEK